MSAQEAISSQKDVPKETQYQQSFQLFASRTYSMLANVYRSQSLSTEAQPTLQYSIELELTGGAIF